MDAEEQFTQKWTFCPNDSNILKDLSQTRSFSLHKMWTDGLVWIVFNQLFGLILTAPIHFRGLIDKQVI